MNRSYIWMGLNIVILVDLIVIIDGTGASLIVTILYMNVFIDLKARINIFDVVQTFSDALQTCV